MAPLPAQRYRVLIVDDDPILRELLCALLSAEDHMVETVEAVDSGEAGLEFLAGSSPEALPSVVLADMQLPGTSGAALAAELRRAAPEARLLGMSGSEPHFADRAAFDAFLLKPFSMEEFHAAVLAVLAAPHAEGAEPFANTPAALSTSGPKPLDERTYARLAAALPAAQLAELYRLSLEDIAMRLGLLRDAWTNGDLATYHREAHALKGGCSMVGARELATLAEVAEFSKSPDPADSTGASSSGDTPTPEDFAAAAERLRSIIAARSAVHKQSH